MPSERYVACARALSVSKYRRSPITDGSAAACASIALVQCAKHAAAARVLAHVHALNPPEPPVAPVAPLERNHHLTDDFAVAFSDGVEPAGGVREHRPHARAQ